MKHRLLFALCAISLLAASCTKPTDDPTPSGGGSSYTPADRIPVFYEANPKVFASSGSLKAITGRLDNIKALGTDILWLMPIYPVGQLKSVGSPYCVKDYQAVNASYGTLADLKALVSAAHGKGMKVILDWVPNHTAWDHPWITDHPDWYTQKDGQIISPEGTGWTDVADLNYGSSAMRAAMQEAMLYWITQADVDGFRCDYADGVPTDFWKDAIAAVRAKKSDAILLAESSDRAYLSAGFDYLYGWSYEWGLEQLLQGTLTVDKFRDHIGGETQGLASGKHILRFITNHDKASEASPLSLFGGADGALAAFVITAFVGESPLIYSSQEIGYASELSFFDNVSLNWSANAAYTRRYEAVMKAYDSAAGIRKGSPKYYSTGDILSLYYQNGDKSLLVLVNTKSTPVEVKTPMERAGEKMTDLVDGGTFTLSSTLSLKGYEYKILMK